MRAAFQNKIKGAYCEFRDEVNTRFLEIHVIDYQPEKIDRLKTMGKLEESQVFSFLKHLDKEIPFDTKYLFKLITYHTDDQCADAWDFNESIVNYEEVAFVSLDELLKYVTEKWGILPSDFKPKTETNIPD